MVADATTDSPRKADGTEPAAFAQAYWRDGATAGSILPPLTPGAIDDASFRLLADNLPTLCWIANGDGYVVWYNRRWYDYTGTTPEQMAGWGWTAVHDPDCLPDVLARWQAAIVAGEPFEMTFPLRGSDGVFRPFLTRIVPVRDATGAVARWCGVNTKIADQVAAEDALREREERLRLVVEGATDYAILTIDPDRLVTSWSNGAEAAFGWTADEMLGRSADTLFTPDDRATGQPEHEAETALRDGVAPDVRWHQRKDGSCVFLNGSLRPLYDGDHRHIGFLKIARDETERHRVDSALRKSESRYRTLFESIDAGFCVIEVLFDPDGHPYDYRYLEANPALEAQTGLTGVVGRTAREVMPGHEQLWIDLYGRVATTGEPAQQEEGVADLNRWYDVRAFRVGAPGQNRVAVLFNDISDRRRAELALQELNRTLEERVAERTAERDRMWDTSPDLMCISDFGGIFRRLNPAWTAVLGYRPDELVGRHVNEFVVADDHAATVDAYQLAAEGGRPVLENRYRHKDGSMRWIAWTAAPAGELTYATGRDITAEKDRQAELERTQEQLRQAQKMEAVGQLTGGIAHDFNNLLTGVIGSLDMMQRRIARGETDKVERYATTAMTSANRAAALTHRLLAFSRRQPLDPKPVNANRLITGMEELLRRTIGEQVRLEIVTAGGLWQTLCDPHQLESAILNLAINARDAMPDGGRLTLETCNAHLDSAYAARSREVKPGQYVCICVTDTGTGMAADVIAKAFEPFFTTKPIGQGTGLGLSMIYGFARQSEGYAKIYSEEGRGTTFKLYLPRYYGEADEAEQAAGQLTDAHRAGAGETVLVVEDESAVRDLVTDVLGELGYRAVEAADGPAGLRLLQSDMRIDLLVTDVGLPGLNGRQLADAARAHRPGLKVLFMTGYAENATVANGFLDPGMAMITKPFAVEALATRIRDMIERD